MPENLLRDLDVASGFEHALRDRVTEKMRMNRDTCSSGDVTQSRLKTRIAKRLASTFPLMEDFAILQRFAETKTLLYLPDGPIDFASKGGRLMGGIRAL